MEKKNTKAIKKILETTLEQANALLESGNFEGAITHYRELADQGNPIAQHKMGRIYDDGTGVEADLETAVQWFKLAAKQDYIDSMFNLAGFYLTGEGGCDVSYDKAYYWFKRAYDLADDQDCYRKMSVIEDSISEDGSEPIIRICGMEFDGLAAAVLEYTGDLSPKKQKELLDFLKWRRHFDEYFEVASGKALEEGSKSITLSQLADSVGYESAYLFLASVYAWCEKLRP